MIAAVVPFKRLANAKSRLAGILSPVQRAHLATLLLRGTLDAIAASERVDAMALVTPERSLALRWDVPVVAGSEDLNEDLRSSVRWAQSIGADSLLILPADLPSIESADVAAIIDTRSQAPRISISATADGGTGALLLSPPNVIPPRFGRDSFARHLRAARAIGVSAERVERPALQFDLDTLEDLQRSGLYQRYVPDTNRFV